MPQFTLRFQFLPPGPFGLPDGDRVVVPSGRVDGDVEGPAFDAVTGKLVRHGTLSQYRKPEQAVQAEFARNGIRFSVRDNIAEIVIESPNSRTAYDTGQELADLIAQGLSVHFGIHFRAEFLTLEDDKGVPHPVPRSYQIPFGITWYDLTKARELLGIAFEWALTSDDRSRKAMLYFEHACVLANFAWSLSPKHAHAAFTQALAFLQLFKAVVIILGEAGVDRDYQRRASALGLPPDFWTSKVKPLYSIRNDDDVAHYSLQLPDLRAFLDRFRDAAAVFREALTAYLRSRQRASDG